jgi:RsiW-degrading membrane proteinase PrsW (M82 family)
VFNYVIKNRNNFNLINILIIYILIYGAGGSVFGEAVCYKLGGRRFESRIRWIFSIYLILAAALWPRGRLSL